MAGNLGLKKLPSKWAIRGQKEIICTDQGKWSEQVPKCDAGICQGPTLLNNGQITGKRTVNSVLYFSCDNGYVIHGATTLTCQTDLQWSGTIPMCNIVNCTTPPIYNGTVHNETAETSYGATVIYNCMDGYVNGSGNLTCTEHGNWTDDNPTCFPFYCAVPLPVPENAAVAFGKPKDKYIFNSSVRFKCNDDYTPTANNDSGAFCNFSKRGWDESQLVCTSKQMKVLRICLFFVLH